MIIATLLASFACEFRPEGNALTREGGVSCLNDSSYEHWIMLCVACFGLFLYFPTAVFMYPVVQCQHQALALKFDHTFELVVGLVKTVLAAMAAFFIDNSSPGDPTSDDRQWGDNTAYCLFFSACLLLVLAVLCWRTMPCLIRRVSYWRAALLAAAAWANFCSVAVMIVAGTQVLGGDGVVWDRGYQLGVVILLPGWGVLFWMVRRTGSPAGRCRITL
jgi:hypothetical protein